MDQKYILLLIIPRCFSVPFHDEGCVIYPFEEEFETQFSSVYECPGKWKLGYYNSILLESPNELSTTFITPSNLFSCVISYIFPMTYSGIVEVNLYMDGKSSKDYISIEVHRVVEGLNAIVGEKKISSENDDFKTGWETVKISLSGSGTFKGYILFTGMASDGSTILIDSFRYIPPLYDKKLCLIYDNTINDSTDFNDYTTIETDQTTQDGSNFNFKEVHGIVDEHTDKNIEITTSIAYADIAMNLVDSTTDFYDVTSTKHSTNHDTTTHEEYHSTRRDETESKIADFTSEAPVQTSQADIIMKTTIQESNTDWDNLIILQDSTTMLPTTLKAEIDVATLLESINLNDVTDSSTEQATSLSENLDNYFISTDMTTDKTNNANKIIPDTTDENMNIGTSVTDTELTTELGTSDSTKVSDAQITTLVNVNYAKSTWNPETSTVDNIRRKESKDSVTSKPIVMKNSTEESKLIKDTEAITNTSLNITTQRTEDDGTFERTLKDVDISVPNVTEIATIKNEIVIINTPTEATEQTTLPTDLKLQTTTIVVSEKDSMNSEFLADFSIYSIVSLLAIVLILTIAILKTLIRKEK